MKIKKIFLGTLIILMALSAYLYINNKYGEAGVEIHFTSNLRNESIIKIKDRLDLKVHSLNYIKPYRNHILIMTSGNDNLFREIPISKGEFLADINISATVIGDKVADRYFRTENVIGKKLYVLDKEYEVIGLISNSDEIYIPYQIELLKESWNKRILRFEPKFEKTFYFVVEEMQNVMKVLGLEIISTIVYREKTYGYINLIMILAVIIIISMLKKYIKRLKKEVLSLWKDYKVQNREIELNKYINRNRKSTMRVLGLFVIDLLGVLLTLKIITLIKLPKDNIPDNLFSPRSYVEVVKNFLAKLSLNMKYGFGDIVIDIMFTNLIMLVIVTVICIKWLSKSKKIEL